MRKMLKTCEKFNKKKKKGEKKEKKVRLMKQYDCVSYAVIRFLEPSTEYASVSDDKDRYYT